MTKVVIDTNIILDTPEVLLRDDYDIILPYVVLQELDGLKKNPDLNHTARNAIKIIKERFSDNKLKIVDIPTDLTTNDELIVDTAFKEVAKLWSGDIGANVVAMSRGVSTIQEETIEYDRSYIGYSEHTVPHDFYFKVLNMNNELQIPEVEEFSNYEAVPNEYCIFKPEGVDDVHLIFRKDTDKYVLITESNKNIRGITVPNTKRGIGFDFLSAEQAIAFDCVFNQETPLAVISGKIGSGKSLLSTVAALARTSGRKDKRLYDRILVSRPNRPISRDYELGFMPGDLDEKMKQWLVGFTSNLEFLFEKTLEDAENRVANTVFEDSFRPISIESIQGASFHKSILLMDEAQLLDDTALKQVMSRIAEGSKLVLILDPEQTYGANRGREGFKALLPHCKGNPLVSYVRLQNIQRSELTALVDNIFN